MEYLHIITIFFISFTGIFYELLLTRLFSFLYFYHNTFIIITIALFFFSLGHIVTHYVTTLKKDTGKYQFIILTVLFILFFTMPFVLKNNSAFPVILYSLIPFTLCGNLASLLYVTYKDKINKLYLLDLGGTILSGMAFIVIYKKIGELNSFLFILFLFLILFIIHKNKKLIALSCVLIFIFAFLMANNYFTLNLKQNFPLRNHMVSKLKFEHAKLLKTFYDYFSRIDVVETDTKDSEISTKYVYFDGTFSARVMRYSPNNRYYYHLLELLHLPFYKHYDNALVLGAGGGMETYFISGKNVKDIESVEISKPVIEYIKTIEECNVLFNSQNIKYINYDARKYLTEGNKIYDLITLSLLETAPASFRAGAHTQNYIFTVEAFKEYADHLTDRGNLVIILNEQKLIDRSLTILLKALGEDTELKDKIIIAKNRVNHFNPYKFMLLYSKDRIGHEDLDSINTICKNHYLKILYSPEHKGDDFYNTIINSKHPEEFYNKFNYEISPVTDNTPFFYNIYKHYNLQLITFAMVLILFSMFIVYTVSSNKNVNINFGLLIISFVSGYAFMSLEQTLIYKFSFFMAFYHKSFVASIIYIISFISIGSLIYIKNIWNIKNNKNLRLLSILYILIIIMGLNFINNLPGICIIFAPIIMIMGVNYLQILNYGRDEHYSLPLIIYFNGMGIFSSGVFNIILLNSLGINMALTIIPVLCIIIFNIMRGK